MRPTHPVSWFTPPLLFVLLVVSCAVTADSQTWSSTGPSAKNIRVVAQSPNSSTVFYAGAFGWGIFKSTDGGATWLNQKAGMTNTYVRSLVVVTDDLVFAGTNDGIFSTTNGGTSWSLSLSTLNSVRSLAYDPSTSVIYAATYGQGMYKSVNLGNSWSPITVTDPVSGETLVRQRTIALFGTDSLYVGGAIGDIATGGALFKSIDGGNSWIQVQRSVGIRSSVMSIAVNPASKSTWLIIGTAARGVYRSRNAGTNWVSLNGQGLPNPLADSSINSVAMTSATCYAGSDSLGRLYYRDVNDSTTGWLSATGVPGTAGVPNSIIVHRVSPSSMLLATEGKGIYSSGNSGSVWIPANTGMMGIDVRDLHVDGSGQLLMATGFGDGIWRSSDQAGTWVRADSLGSSNSVTSIATTSAAGVAYCSVYGTGVFKTTNAGAWWYVTDSTVLNHFARCVVAHPSNANTVYAGTGNGVFKTTNGGTGWFQAGTGIPPNTSIRSLELDPKNPSLLLAGSDSSYLYRSTNSGSTWTNISGGFLTQDRFIRTITVDTAATQVVLAGADSGRIYRSTDSGVSWTLLIQLPTTKSVRRILIHPVIHSTMFAATFGSGLFASVDDGAHWAGLNTGLSDLELNALAAIGTTPLTLIAGSANSGAYRMTYSGQNDPPVLSPIGNRSVLPDNILSIQLHATDPQGTIPTLTVGNAPSGSSFVDSGNGSALFTWLPGNADIGVYMVTFRATDGQSVDSEIVSIHVLDPNEVIVDLNVEAGWNLVSVPVSPSSMSVGALFPTASTTAYGYQTGYFSKDPLVNGEGYWLKFPAPQLVQLGGAPVVQETLTVPSRWSIIGSLSFPVPVGHVSPVPPLSITSQFFGFSPSGGYVAVDTLVPGRAYWMKANQAGQVILDTSTAPVAAPVQAVQSDITPALHLTDGIGLQRVIPSPVLGPDGDFLVAELPPPPPDGIFDVRWHIVEGRHARLEVRSATYPVTCAWTSSAGIPPYALAIRSAPDGDLLRQVVSGSFTLLPGDELIAMPATQASAPGVQARRYALEQSYPNPFNPVTSIRYELEAPGVVTLHVYNAVGQHVARLVDERQDEGSHIVRWDATGFPSGIYYYVLDVMNPATHSHAYRSAHTMMLLK